MNLNKIEAEKFDSIIFFTGAGMSKESNIDTYRGEGGIWNSYNWKEFACQKAFIKDPLKVQKFHEVRRKEIFDKKPHHGYEIISSLQKKHNNVHILTQNIDGLHRKCRHLNVIELHGSLWHLRCEKTRNIFEDREKWKYKRRKCRCSKYLRPDIIWFEDNLKKNTLSSAIKLAEKCNLFISVGTSGLVYPSASIPSIAKKAGAFCIEINPEETELSYLYDHTLRQRATSGLKSLFI